MKYCFLFGFLLALVWWSVKRFGPVARSAVESVLPASIFKIVNGVLFKPIAMLKHVHPSLFMNGMITWAPYNLSFWTGGFYVSVAFMYYLRRYKTAWWEKYNYVLSAGLSGGMAFSAVIISSPCNITPRMLFGGATPSTTIPLTEVLTQG